jgi:hypothetical protein
VLRIAKIGHRISQLESVVGPKFETDHICCNFNECKPPDTIFRYSWRSRRAGL